MICPEEPVFWHLATYATRSAAEAARDPRSTVVESLGQVWLFTIADAEWSVPGGEFAAKIGPLPIRPNLKYEAVYM